MSYLLGGTKKTACQSLRSVFDRDVTKGTELVHELCDHLLTTKDNNLDRTDTLEWLKALFTSDGIFENFCLQVTSVDSSPLCGCVWTANFVAYRCRTCATSPCMSLCAACFEKGNHTGHDYNIFRSEAGGACDCGDDSVMNKNGFCSHHGPNRIAPDPLPCGFLDPAKVLLERLILFLVHNLRQRSKNVLSSHTFVVNFSNEAEKLFSFMLELIKLGSAIRSLLSDILLNKQLYLDLMQCKGYKSIADSNSELSAIHRLSILSYTRSVEALEEPLIPNELIDKEKIKKKLKHETYLDELTYWIVRYEFPEPLILILLNLLPDLHFKKEFAKSFTRHYSRIAASLSSSADTAQLSNRVVHISVQLFSNDEIAFMLVQEEYLLETFMISVYNIMHNNMEVSRTNERDFHQCISSSSDDIRSNAYWPVVSDFVNVLSHQRCVHIFLGNPDLVNCWVQLMLSFSGMDLTHRAMLRHVEYEPNQALVAFYTEREACASTLWSLLEILQDQSTAHLSVSMINILSTALTDLFDALGFETELPYDQISFHYPLHRYLAHFLSNAIRKQGVSVPGDINITEEFALKIMQHPLQVLVTTEEIECAMWVRNGLHLSTQALAYKQYFFCTFFIDADLYLLQFCASLLPPDVFVRRIFSRCRVNNCMSVASNCDSSTAPPNGPDEDRQPKLLEAAFHLLAAVLGVRTNVGLNPSEIIQSEAVVLLTNQACTYSTLYDHVPQCHESHSGPKLHNNTSLLTECLKTLAVKKEGGAMEQTTYVPQASAWKLYDPIYTEHRTLYKKNVQQAHTNFFKYLQGEGKISTTATASGLWPPYQPIKEPPSIYSNLINLLHCPTTHTFIYIILFKALADHQVVNDKTLSLTMHLLESSLRLPVRPSQDRGPTSHRRPSLFSNEPDFSSWFDSSDIVVNIVKVIDQVQSSSFESSEDLRETVTVVKTSESIVSMLIKLYAKFSSAGFSFTPEFDVNASHVDQPPTRSHVISRILHLAASKSECIRQNIVQTCAMIQSPMTQQSDAFEDERMRRRKKAREAQERLMKQFAMKQKQFLENVSVVDATEPDDVAITDEKPAGMSPSMECVICGKSEGVHHSSEVVGLVCFAQPSKVLGHRSSDKQRPSPCKPPNLAQNKNKFSTFCKLNNSVLAFSHLQLQAGDSCPPSSGVHVSTCGHHLHIKCHQDYMQSVFRDGGHQSGDIRGAFRCPICRQWSNVVLPCNLSSVADEVAENYVGPIFQRLEAICQPYLMVTTMGNPYLVLFTTIEHRLLQLGNSLLDRDSLDDAKSPQVSAKRKIPVDTIFKLAVPRSKSMLASQPSAWDSPELGGFRRLKKVPLLMLDPCAILVRMTMDLCTSAELFQTHMVSLFHLAFVQSLVKISIDLPREERRAWTSSALGSRFVGDNLQCILGHVIRSLPPDLFRRDSASFRNYTTDVFLPQSIFASIESLLLPFLRFASLLKNHLFLPHDVMPLPKSGRSEFLSLVTFLELCGDVDAGDDVSVLQCLRWEDGKSLITAWCDHLKSFSVKPAELAICKQLVSQNRIWNSPQLLDLPDEYSKLFLMFRQTKCVKCGNVPKDPTICLVCGEFVCYKSLCDSPPHSSDMFSKYAASRHAERCGAGTCVLLQINTSLVVIIRGTRACIWGTLYLDSHGEEDRGWHRGKPLFLKRERLMVLERQWIDHMFDNVCKNWALHRNSL